MMRGPLPEHGPVVPGSGGPAYQQISELLTREITGQVWKAGDALPNEKKLSLRFNVSIGTVRRAIDTLEKSGLVIRRQGLGTFVTEQGLHQDPPVYEHADPFRLNAVWATEHSHKAVKSELISLETITAGSEESIALGINTGDPVWRIEVRHMLHTQLIAYEQLHVSRKLFPGLDLKMLETTQGNLYRLASEVFQVRIGQVTDEVTVKTMEPHIASLFNKIPEAPSLRVYRITHSMDNTPMEKREVWLDPSYAHYKAHPELSSR
ncbi:MAG TPA: GntR family transcriptional regulator [Limnobacter sp.]|nr:GntR family transcriptional regulator [Limnobacter sp.]